MIGNTYMIGDAYELHIPGKLYVIRNPLSLLHLCENYVILGKERIKYKDLIFCLKSDLEGHHTMFQNVVSHFLFGTKTLIFTFPFSINPEIIDLYK